MYNGHMRWNFLAIVTAGFLIFFFSWVVAYKSGINDLAIQSEDTVPALFLPVTIIKDKTFYADRYYEYIRSAYPHPDDKNFEKNLTPFYLKKVGEHYLSAFPLVAGLIALPVFYVPVVSGMEPAFENLAVLGHITAALVVSLSGGVMHMLLRKYFFLDEFKSRLLTAVYLFGTINFALLSQALWQHGILEFFTLLSIYFLYSGFAKSKLNNAVLATFLSGLFIFLGVITRPTAFLIVPFVGLLILEKYGRSARKLIFAGAAYALGAVPPFLFFLWYNGKYYLDISNQGYAKQLFAGWLSGFPEGFLGTWVSPSKGILVYSPVLVFALVGFWLAIRKGLWRENFKYIVFGSIVILHTMVMGRWKHWYGGWSFGYRMASDILPFMILLMVPYAISPVFQKTKKLFYALFCISVGMEVMGIFFFDGIWHAAYDRGFRDMGWLWSIKDSELVFNIRRVLVKFGLLDKACPSCLPGVG